MTNDDGHEVFESVKSNNAKLDMKKDFPFCFSCKQGRLEDFYEKYLGMVKHERMKCLLCVSGLKHVPAEMKRSRQY